MWIIWLVLKIRCRFFPPESWDKGQIFKQNQTIIKSVACMQRGTKNMENTVGKPTCRTVKTGLFFHFFTPNSPFTEYGLVKHIFGEHSVCLLTQICLCYYTNTIFPYQNTNSVGSTFWNVTSVIECGECRTVWILTGWGTYNLHEATAKWVERGAMVQEVLSSNPTRDIFLNGQYNLTEMIWSKGVENRLTTSIIS